MSRPFSAARLRRSPSFRRLTGVGVTTFDAMLKRLQTPWDEAQAGKLKSGCVSAWKKDPSWGVIGVQKGPL